MLVLKYLYQIILRIAIFFSCLLVDALNAFLILLLDSAAQNIHDLPEIIPSLINQASNFQMSFYDTLGFY